MKVGGERPEELLQRAVAFLVISQQPPLWESLWTNSLDTGKGLYNFLGLAGGDLGQHTVGD